VGLEDGALRATLALRLSLMLERRGDVRRGAMVAAEAAAAADGFRTAAVDRARGAADEPTRHVTAESVWGATSGDGTGPDGSLFAFTPTSLAESDQAYACLHADLLAWGLLTSSTPSTLNVFLLLRASSIHPESKSYEHVRYRFECLFSMTLLRGRSLPSTAGGRTSEPTRRGGPETGAGGSQGAEARE